MSEEMVSSYFYIDLNLVKMAIFDSARYNTYCQDQAFNIRIAYH